MAAPWLEGIDPELVPGLTRYLQLVQGASPTASPLSTAELFPGSARLSPPAPQAIERRIPGPSRSMDLRVLIIEPNDGGHHRPALLHMHGGGFIAGQAELYRSLQEIAQTCACVVVSVDYRLAPAARYSESLEDNYAALRWLHSHAVELGVDSHRIAVGGESAGGGHAALLAIAARDRGEVPLLYQWLIYPMLDDRTGSSRAAPAHTGRCVWTAESNTAAWTAFLGVAAGSKDVPQNAVPARVAHLAGLPPTFIGTGALDLFVQENIEYAARLSAAGVPVELHLIPGGYHGFDVIAPEAQVSQRFTKNWLAALRGGLGSAWCGQS